MAKYTFDFSSRIKPDLDSGGDIEIRDPKLRPEPYRLSPQIPIFWEGFSGLSLLGWL